MQNLDAKGVWEGKMHFLLFSLRLSYGDEINNY